MLKKLRLRFVGINMAIVLVILCTIFGVLLHTTHANLERESVDMITAVATEGAGKAVWKHRINIPWWPSSALPQPERRRWA